MTLLYFAPVPWDSYLQRPHYFVRHFMQPPGRRVLWVDPYPTRFPALKDLRWKRPQPPLALGRPPGLTVVHPHTLPFEPLGAGRWVNRSLAGGQITRELAAVRKDGPLIIGIGRPSSLGLAALTTLESAWSFYDAMDDFPEFYRGLAQQATAECEREIAARVDTIVTVSSALWNKFSPHSSKRMMIANAFEMSSLPPVSDDRGGPTVFGYIGCIASWFDWRLVLELAEAQPEASVHVVGPPFQAPPGRLPANVQMFPACSHAEGVRHMARFSAGLIPFLNNRLTAGVDPIKYYGYRGMGIPVLSSAFGEMARRHAGDGVYFLDGSRGIAAAIEAALAHRDSPVDVDDMRASHSWQRRFSDARLFEDLVSS